MKKKVLALVMAAAMTFGTMGMSTVAFAEGNPTETVNVKAGAKVPNVDDKGMVTVSNVQKEMEVTAYQIVKAKYGANNQNFVGYEPVSGVNIAKAEKPTDNEITTIAKAIAAGTLTTLPSEKLDWNGEKYTANLNAGYWLILVKNRTATESLEMYNPMLAGVYYSLDGSGDNNTLVTEEIDHANWTLNGTNAWAKHAAVSFDKKLVGDHTVDLGEKVTYEINTVIPDYSDAYASATFNITDKMAGLTLDENNIKVYVDDNLVTAGEDTFALKTKSTNSELTTDFAVEFASAYVLQNTKRNVKVTYDAVVTDEEKVNEAPFSNDATLVYSTAPYEGSTGMLKDTEKAYTFDIDGNITEDILKKVGEDGSTALGGATFGLYTDEACTTPYENGVEPVEVTAVSTNDGKLQFTGLDEGEYYLKETDAPKGYTLNPTVYKIVIKAEFSDTEKNNLKSWTVKVSEVGKTDSAVTNTFNVNGGTASAAQGNTTTTIQNTKLSNLPSTGGIGTTIFTIGGCVIMIAAAGIFFVSRKKENENK